MVIGHDQQMTPIDFGVMTMQVTPIDFEVKGSKVKVTLAL
jgi:hypothetical protein